MEGKKKRNSLLLQTESVIRVTDTSKRLNPIHHLADDSQGKEIKSCMWKKLESFLCVASCYSLRVKELHYLRRTAERKRNSKMTKDKKKWRRKISFDISSIKSNP